MDITLVVYLYNMCALTPQVLSPLWLATCKWYKKGTDSDVYGPCKQKTISTNFVAMVDL